MVTMSKKTDKDFLGIAFKGSKNETLTYLKRPTLKLDENGVLLYKIPYTDNFDYYPIFIARNALGNLELFIENNDEKYKQAFFDQVQWLLKNLKYKENFAVWEHHYKLPYYEEYKIPWIHGLAQGLGMTALLKAYQVTGKKDYLNASEKVFNSMEVDIADGGIRFTDENDSIWLEEYALSPPPHVLNGFITILFGVNEFYKLTGKEKALKLWDEGIKTIKSNLGKYEAGYWSFYDLSRKYPSTKNYHKLHIWQLKTLHELTKEQMFEDYSKKWEQYNNKMINKKIAGFNRGFVHLRRYGLIDCVNRYIKRKKWNKKNMGQKQ